jgi:hypothetical protein
MQSFDETRFQQKVDNALHRVRTILATTREPTYPSDVFHKYEDKYFLAEFLTNTALASQVNCLELLGVDGEKLKTMKEWATARSVTLRLSCEETCVFDRQEERKVESPTTVVETKGFLGK